MKPRPRCGPCAQPSLASAPGITRCDLDGSRDGVPCSLMLSRPNWLQKPGFHWVSCGPPCSHPGWCPRDDPHLLVLHFPDPCTWGVLMGPSWRAGGPASRRTWQPMCVCVCTRVCMLGAGLRGQQRKVWGSRCRQLWGVLGWAGGAALQDSSSGGCGANLPPTQAWPWPDSLCLTEFSPFFKWNLFLIVLFLIIKMIHDPCKEFKPHGKSIKRNTKTSPVLPPENNTVAPSSAGSDCTRHLYTPLQEQFCTNVIVIVPYSETCYFLSQYSNSNVFLSQPENVEQYQHFTWLRHVSLCACPVMKLIKAFLWGFHFF